MAAISDADFLKIFVTLMQNSKPLAVSADSVAQLLVLLRLGSNDCSPTDMFPASISHKLPHAWQWQPQIFVSNQ